MHSLHSRDKIDSMKIHRFVSQYESNKNTITVTDKDTLFQIVNVLKLEPGEHIILSDGNGIDKEIVLIEAHKRNVAGTLYRETAVEKPLTLHAYIALLKKDNLELALQKIVEIGVTDITPMVTTRTIKKGYNKERLEKIIKEAVEQSGQSYLPVLHSETTFERAVDYAQGNTDMSIFFDEPALGDTHISFKNKTVSFFIGPEGGFTPEEIAVCETKKLTPVSLGHTTLRAETAALVGTFWIKERQ